MPTLEEIRAMLRAPLVPLPRAGQPRLVCEWKNRQDDLFVYTMRLVQAAPITKIYVEMRSERVKRPGQEHPPFESMELLGGFTTHMEAIYRDGQTNLQVIVDNWQTFEAETKDYIARKYIECLKPFGEANPIIVGQHPPKAITAMRGILSAVGPAVNERKHREESPDVDTFTW